MNIPNQSDRINHLLWMQMESPIIIYLMANTKGRLDSHQKADYHIELVHIYLASILLCNKHETHFNEDPDGMELFDIVHDHTQELTEYMDKVIGFPINGLNPNYKKLASLFFKKFLSLANEAINNYMANEANESYGK